MSKTVILLKLFPTIVKITICEQCDEIFMQFLQTNRCILPLKFCYKRDSLFDLTYFLYHSTFYENTSLLTKVDTRFPSISPDFVEAKTHDLPISRFWRLESMRRQNWFRENLFSRIVKIEDFRENNVFTNEKFK
jgi:hypothetical protein